MPDYRVEITTLGGSTKVADLFFTDLTITDVLNGPGAASFAVPLLHADATADNLLPGAREVRVYRGSTRIFGGYLWAVTADLNARVVRCAAEGWLSRLRKRLVTADLVWTGADQYDIAWDLIAHTQTAASLGITRGSSGSSGVTRDLIVCVEDEEVVANAIEALAATDPGFDYWIDANKVWRTASPRRGSASGVTFNASVDVKRLRLDIDAADTATQVIGYEESVNCVPQTTALYDAGAVSTYGLLQSALWLGDIKDAGYRADRLAEEYRLRSAPTKQAVITTSLNPWAAGYGVGDTAGLTVAAGLASYTDEQFRILSHATTVRGASESTQVVLDSVIA